MDLGLWPAGVVLRFALGLSRLAGSGGLSVETNYLLTGNVFWQSPYSSAIARFSACDASAAANN